MKKYFPKNALESLCFTFADHIPYIDNLNTIKHARYIITDSGGIQREAFYLNKRCVVRSNSTIWEAIVGCGSNIVVGSTLREIQEGISWAELNRTKIYADKIFGNGNAVKDILIKILSESVSSDC